MMSKEQGQVVHPELAEGLWPEELEG